MCGIVGVIDLEGKKDVTEIGIAMASALQHRGEEGAGMLWIDENGHFQTVKDTGTVQQVLSSERLHIGEVLRTAVLLQDRYPTTEFLGQEHAQPNMYAEFGMVFNGTIANYKELQPWLAENEYTVERDGDTEVVGQLLRYLSKKHIGSLRDTFSGLNRLDGAYNLITLQHNGTLTGIRDPKGFHPLCMAQKGSLVGIASESAAFKDLKAFKRATVKDIKPGHAVVASPHTKSVTSGKVLQRIEPYDKKARCFFEWIYFSDQATVIDTHSVSKARYEAGKATGAQDNSDNFPQRETAIVVPVPRTARTAANGYANERDMPIVEGIMRRNSNNSRTFTAATDQQEKIRAKYTFRSDLLRNQSAVVIDDSIVRGYTMKEGIIPLLYEAGVKEIHLRIPCPPIQHPCFYGMAFPRREDLFAPYFTGATLTEKGVPTKDALQEMATALNVTSIRFMPSIKIPEVINSRTGKIKGLCMACVDGRYPTAKGQELSDADMELFQLQLNKKQ